jgi:cytoskeletal protein CcmA (bactofilin family)
MQHRMGRMRKVAWLAAVTFLVLVGASVALAQTQLGGKIRAGDQIVVTADETVDGDLYASGGQVRIEGTVDGDLLVASGTVTISGQVTGDLMAAGGTVDVSGEVMGDARIAAGQLTLSGSVGEDLFLTAGQATVSSSGEVGEDLVFGNGRMTMSGAVTGDVLGATGMYDRQGTVGGNENVTIDRGDEEEAAPTAADRLLDALQRLISIFLITALVLWLAPRLIDEPAATLRRRPLASLGIGLVALIGFGVLVFLVIVVAVLVSILLALVGLADLVGAIVFGAIVAVAVLLFLFFLATVFGAPAWVGLALARIALPNDSPGRRWGALIIGLIVVVALSAIPVVGGWIGFLVVVFGLGALVLGFWPRRRTPVYSE